MRSPVAPLTAGSLVLHWLAPLVLSLRALLMLCTATGHAPSLWPPAVKASRASSSLEYIESKRPKVSYLILEASQCVLNTPKG